LGQQTENIMKMTNIALLVGFSIVALATPALAAVKDSSGATKGRDAAVAACNAEAQKHYGGMYYNFDQTRDFAYEHCMHDRGVAQ
jgi:hypothetical protein